MPSASDRDEEINMLARLWNAPRQLNDASELSNLNFAANWERVLQALAIQPVQTFSEETQPRHAREWQLSLEERIQQTEHQLEEPREPQANPPAAILPRTLRRLTEWQEREVSELMAMTQNLEKEIKKQAEKPEIKRKNRYQILKENSADAYKSPI